MKTENWLILGFLIIVVILVMRGLTATGSSVKRRSARRAWIDSKVQKVANLKVGETYTVHSVTSLDDYEELCYQMKGYGAKCGKYQPEGECFTVEKITGRLQAQEAGN